MKEPLWERIKQFCCKIFGHNFDESSKREFNGKIFLTCRRCLRTLKRKDGE